MSLFRKPSSSEPCPVCQGTTARCVVSDGLALCGNLADEPVTSGYEPVGNVASSRQKFVKGG